MVRFVIRGKDIEIMKFVRPTTHEIGGVFIVKDKYIQDVKMSGGGKCRDADGKLLPNVTNCSVSHPDGKIVFHSHPRANRPSSSDLISSVGHYPERKVNIVFSPVGMWVYGPTPFLVEKIHGMSETAVRRLVKSWRFLGHVEQEATQAGSCASFQKRLQDEGFKTKYIPYSEVTPTSEWEIDMGN